MKCLVSIILLILISCGKEHDKEVKKEFIQPEVLTMGAGFDLTQLTFNEDFKKLVSKSLDTIDNDYTLSNFESAIYPTDERRKIYSDDKRITFLEEKRYYFKLLELDSIAQFHGLYANYMDIETDENLKIKTVLANARVNDTIALDALLHKLYELYGQTVYMQTYKEKYGTERKYFKRENEQGKYENETELVEKDIDYESFLYEYKSNLANNRYLQWNLKDRIIQIDISRGFEASINFTTSKMDTDDFFSVSYLQMSKVEYDLIRKRLIDVSTKNDFPAVIKKPYYIKELDFYQNEQKYVNRNKNVYPKTDYDFNQ